MTLTSSEILKRLEKDAFAIHIKQKRIEALMAEVSASEANMLDTARSLYADENLVQAAIMMAQMSIPALEEKATRILLEGAQSTSAVTQRQRGETTGEFGEDVPEAASDPDVDPVTEANGDDDGPSDDAQRSETDRINEEEFFSVDVPAAQIDLARMIKYEAAVSVKQNTKNNTYATDRGKNAWRKLLFTRARAEYLKNGVPLSEGGDVQADTKINGTQDENAFSIDEPAQTAAHAEIDQTSLPSGDAVDGDREISDFSDEDEPVFHDSHDSDEDSDPSSEDETIESVDVPTDESDFLPDETGTEDEPDVHLEDAAAISSVASFDEIPFFDEPAIEPDVSSTVTDDDTLTVDGSIFSEDLGDDGHHLDPIVLEEEASSDEHAAEVQDDVDIEPPEFDPDAELFDEKAASTPEVQKPVDIQPSSTAQALPDRPSPAAHPRAVSVESIPAHLRPGAPRVPSAPSRPGPSAPSSRVVSGEPSTSKSSVEVSGPDRQSGNVASTKPTPAGSEAPAAPSRQAPGRTSPGPAKAPSAPARTHGYGARVPAPDGLEQAIRERDAAANAKVGAQPSAPTPSAPPRPGAAPSRPMPFTKPNFGR